MSQLPYVECDPKGVNPRPDLCEKVPVRAYPTWVIDGEKYEGVMSLERLADLSKFRYATPTQAKP
ncbi:MAG TPA: hypothetical protein VMI34_20805 [Candidatus Bathyarchaeia archaeon]|nr:hypothetical protein [Candidatus Bathyarchaeia archaeon]